MKKVFFFFPSLLRVWRGLMTHVNIIRARKGRGRINAAITARLDAQACKPDRKFNWIPSNSSWISSPRVVDFQRDGRIKQHQTHKISLTNSFSSSTISTRCERSRNCSFLANIFLSFQLSFVLRFPNEIQCVSRCVRIAKFSARSGGGRARKSGKSRGGTLFTRGRESNPIKRKFP